VKHGRGANPERQGSRPTIPDQLNTCGAALRRLHSSLLLPAVYDTWHC